MTTVWAEAITGVSVTGACWDWRHRTIPRWLTVPAAAAGLLHGAWAGSFLSSFAAAGLGLGLGLLLLQLGAFGGGDAKLLAAMGALLGLRLWFWSVSFGMMAAGAGALLQLAARGRLPFLGSDLAAIAGGWRRQGLQPHPEYNLQNPGAVTAPFGVALGLGVLCALWL